MHVGSIFQGLYGSGGGVTSLQMPISFPHSPSSRRPCSLCHLRYQFCKLGNLFTFVDGVIRAASESFSIRRLKITLILCLFSFPGGYVSSLNPRDRQIKDVRFHPERVNAALELRVDPNGESARIFLSHEDCRFVMHRQSRNCKRY